MCFVLDAIYILGNTGWGGVQSYITKYYVEDWVDVIFFCSTYSCLAKVRKTLCRRPQAPIKIELIVLTPAQANRFFCCCENRW